MQLEEYLKQAARSADAELELFFQHNADAKWLEGALGKPDFDFDVSAVQKAIFDPIWDFLSRGGKRWRPALMLLASEAVGGRRKKVMPFTVIPELVHSGTIMIDDVEDNSVLRRGKPSTHLLFGIDIAINAGNAMYYLPLAAVFRNKKLASTLKARIYDLYALEMLRLSFGQAMDIHWHRGGSSSVTQGQYLQMCSYKTGSLARLAAELGAVLGGASEQQVNALGDFAASIGVAFQIQDDVLNIKPVDSNWGKEVGDDIKEGKRTLMVIHALSVLPQVKHGRLLAILGMKEKGDSDVREAISLIEEAGSIAYARGVAKQIVSKSWKRLFPKLKDSPAKKLLKEFADYLVERKI